MSIHHSANLLVLGFCGISIESNTVDLGVLFNQVFNHVSSISRSGRRDLLNIVISAGDRVRFRHDLLNVVISTGDRVRFFFILFSLSLDSFSHLLLDIVMRNHVINEVCVIIIIEDSVCIGPK